MTVTALQLKSADKKPDNLNDWKKWTGGEPPAPYGTKVDVIKREGSLHENVEVTLEAPSPANRIWWSHSTYTTHPPEITGWRVHVPQQVPTPAAIDPTLSNLLRQAITHILQSSEAKLWLPEEIPTFIHEAVFLLAHNSGENK